MLTPPVPLPQGAGGAAVACGSHHSPEWAFSLNSFFPSYIKVGSFVPPLFGKALGACRVGVRGWLFSAARLQRWQRQGQWGMNTAQLESRCEQIISGKQLKFSEPNEDKMKFWNVSALFKFLFTYAHYTWNTAELNTLRGKGSFLGLNSDAWSQRYKMRSVSSAAANPLIFI